VALIPSRHTLPLVKHNNTKNADLDVAQQISTLPLVKHNITSQQTYKVSFKDTKDSTCYRTNLKSIQDEINAISKKFSTFLKSQKLFFCIYSKLLFVTKS